MPFSAAAMRVSPLMRPALGGESCHKIHRTQGGGWAPGCWHQLLPATGTSWQSWDEQRIEFTSEGGAGGAHLGWPPGEGDVGSRKPPLLGQGRAEIRFGEEAYPRGIWGRDNTPSHGRFP